MERYELQKLRDLPIEGVAQRLGLRVVRHKALCPFHEDHHPSLSFCLRKNTFRCFVCDAHGGTIDLVMQYLRLDFLEACRWLQGRAPLPPGGGSQASAQTSAQEQLPSSPSSSSIGNPPPGGRGAVSCGASFDAARYGRFFERPWLSDEARRFLFDERRLDARVVRWCRLTSWRDKQGISWLQIPYYDRQGKLIGVQNRNLKAQQSQAPLPPGGGSQTSAQASAHEQLPSSPTSSSIGNPPPGGRGAFSSSSIGNPPPGGRGAVGRGALASSPRFRFPYGSRCGIYNLPVLNKLRPGEELWITEGCSDCWAMLSSGRKAIAIPSATLLSQKDKDILSTLSSQLSLSFHMYPDRDAPGERLFLQLKQVLPTLQHHQLPQGCKDYAEYYSLTPGPSPRGEGS